MTDRDTMVAFGFSLSSEEVEPTELVRLGRIAELAGFDFLSISDHFHPWTPSQGNSAYVWSVLGALAVSTERIRVGTGVTCPTIRQHPAIVAQAAATMAMLMEGRFFLGVGTGENLNEHVTGQRWPRPPERLDMLDEAVGLIRKLWTGDQVSESTPHFEVDRARLYSLPQEPPVVHVAASGPNAAELAGRIGDGLVLTSPDRELVTTFADAGGVDKPVYAQVTVCHGPDRDEAVQEALHWWPTAGVPGSLNAELATPEEFESVAELVTAEQVADKIVCGPELDEIVDRVATYVDAGVDHVQIHQVGPRQGAFLETAGEELLPRLRDRWPSIVQPEVA